MIYPEDHIFLHELGENYKVPFIDYLITVSPIVICLLTVITLIVYKLW